jgi:hypothetical protein
MIPVDLIMVVWVWGGRLLFGSAGWFLLIMLFAVPFLLLALAATTVLAFLQPVRPRALSRGQAVTHLLMWGGMLAFGFFIVDFGDADASDTSAFTQVVGRNDATLAISWTLVLVAAAVTVVAWVVLLVLLVAGRRRHEPVYAASLSPS